MTNGLPSQRAREALEKLRKEFAWVDDESTAVVRGSDSEPRWWTFAGLRANAALAVALSDLVDTSQVRDNLALPLRAGVDGEAVRRRLDDVGVVDVPVPPQKLTDLKFGACLPVALAIPMIETRAKDLLAMCNLGSEPVREFRDGSGCLRSRHASPVFGIRNRPSNQRRGISDQRSRTGHTSSHEPCPPFVRWNQTLVLGS